MEPSNPNSLHPQELPAPVDPEQSPAEIAAQPEISGNQTQPLTPAPSVAPIATPILPTAPAPIDPATITGSGGMSSDNLIADDSDLIEKEWVLKAKAIVAQTKNDPYTQNRSMTEVKADYLKKRYNKDLKISEG